MAKKVVISGYYGCDNFGDETILKVLVDKLKEENADITVLSLNPEKTKALHKVKTVKSFDLLRVITTIMKSDVLISGGGSLLQDATSLKSLLYYLFVISVAEFFHKKVFCKLFFLIGFYKLIKYLICGITFPGQISS